MKNGNKLIHLAVTPLQKTQIEELMNVKGAMSQAEIIRQAISFLHQRTFKDYVEVQKQRVTTKSTPEQKATAQVETAELRTKLKTDREKTRGLKICEMLGGEIKDENGFYSCIYPTYEKMNKHDVFVGENTVPFSHLDEELIENQYKGGTKKEILEMLKNQDE